MTRIALLSAGAIALTACGIVAFADSINPASQKRSLADQPTLVKRGEYLVHGIGMCSDCHSPRNETGAFLDDKHLTGSPIPFTPSVPMPAWAPFAPAIAGLPAGWTEEAMVTFLMNGERPNHLPPTRPPMPSYRLSRADAEAVVAYIRAMAKEKN